MPYRTVSIRLLDPTARKRALLDDALFRYTAALDTILRDLEADARQSPPRTKANCTALLHRQRMALADPFDAQPFKDALKVDLARLLITWSGRGGAWPLVRAGDEDLRTLLESEEPPAPGRLHRALDRHGAAGPLLFPRYDAARGFALLRDEATGRYYARLCLRSRSGLLSAPAGDHPLRDLCGGEPPRPATNRGVRWALFPLQPGDWQRRHLDDVQAGLCAPRSALLLRRGDDYFLQVRLEYPAPPPVAVSGWLGVVRGVSDPLCYAACSADGAALASGVLQLDLRSPGREGALHRCANEIVALALDLGCALVLENLAGEGDDLGLRHPLVGRSDYNRLAELVRYKAEAVGLPPPIPVRARRIYQRCPVCGAQRKLSRFDAHTLLCVLCGAFQPAQEAAARNLCLTPLRYSRSRLPVRVVQEGDMLHFSARALGLRYSCPRSPDALEQFLDYFRDYISREDPDWPPARRSAVRRLREAPDPQDLLDLRLRRRRGRGG